MVKFYVKRKGFTLLELTIVFVIIFVLCQMAIPTFRHGSNSPSQRACFRNQRNLLGAIEMYNLDHKNALRELNNEVIEMLIKEEYLKGDLSNFVCPGNSYKRNYLSLGNILKSGVIYCEYHGTLDGMEIKPGMTFMDFLEERERRTREDIQKALKKEQFMLAKKYTFIGLILSVISSLFYIIYKKIMK